MSPNTGILALLGLGLGIAGGIAVAVFSGSPGEAPSPAKTRSAEASASTPADGRPACEEAARLRVQVGTQEARLRVLRTRLTRLQDERRSIAGDPLPWLDDTLPEARPEAVESAMQRAAEAADVELVTVECEEPPCVAMIRAPIPADADFGTEQDRIREALSDSLDPLSFGGSSSITEGEDGGVVLSIYGPVWAESWWDAFPEDAQQRRVRFRREALPVLMEEED